MIIQNYFKPLAIAGVICFATFSDSLINQLAAAPFRNISTATTQSNFKEENLIRSMALIDKTIATYFDPVTFEMKRFYNPFTKVKSDERASVWMYSAGIEAINAVLACLKAAKDHGHSKLYDANFDKYNKLLAKMYDNADYYLGTFELTSFTQTKEWSVYAVDRVNEKGKANVTGILNVYDDQMWLLRELLDSYKITGNKAYLEKAEYLTAYVLDGWDVTIDENGAENGGIPWGPGYTTKHACSNSPLISSLVWLHQIYKDKNDKIERRYIDSKDKKTRLSEHQTKDTYYLNYAKAIYAWQKQNLLNNQGVYTDMMGGCVPDCGIVYEVVDGKKYRANTKLTDAVGEAFTYNSGTMISGAVDLYEATKDAKYLKEATDLGEASFKQFAFLGKDVAQYYSFGTDGFKNWFNGILMRGYRDLALVNEDSEKYLSAFQKNLDYGYEKFNHGGFLPTDLLKGWSKEKDGQGVEGMFMFTYAAQYAVLAEHYIVEGTHKGN
ncbi:glycoside hydrolase family 76 protein [Sphingobacterium daejeonense]|uniref:glycoside hydrolase family 76 protein n=1 Tax=Sphingobacterium daejeonense TaxID=371142 RepID=UPI0021A88390|nr:glycoside hydrolase family 76 protein [Sphingobacterium daejeonense]MCT1530931.1 glycoside hydrolase family 76 protein [Sphingobacterium daejeonense]